MNEKLRELILQAREETREGKWKPPTAVWTERFAELIVKECLNAIEPIDRDSQGWRLDDYCEARNYQDKIKEHFGIE